MAYPKALLPNEFEVGQPVWVLMTCNGKEREKHTATLERPNDFDNWVFEGYVDRIDEEILTVKVTEYTKNQFALPVDTFGFYIHKKYHQVGILRPDYRLFRTKEEAYSYERKSACNRARHIEKKAELNEYNRRYNKEHWNEVKNKRKKYLDDFKDEHKKNVNAYYREKSQNDEYREGINKKHNEYRKQRRIDDAEYREKENKKSRELHKRKYETDPVYREKIREQNRNRAASHPEYSEKANEKRKVQYATDPEYREKEKERGKRKYERYMSDPEYREREKERSRKYREKKKAEKESGNVT